MTEANKALISEFISRVLNQKQLDALEHLVAVDFAELEPLPGQRQGREGLREVLAGMFMAFPDMHWTIH